MVCKVDTDTATLPARMSLLDARHAAAACGAQDRGRESGSDGHDDVLLTVEV